MDLLKRIELRMEFLTQHLERLPAEKVKIAQRVSYHPSFVLVKRISFFYYLSILKVKECSSQSSSFTNFTDRETTFV